MEGHSDEALEEIRNSLAEISADHTARLTGVTLVTNSPLRTYVMNWSR